MRTRKFLAGVFAITGLCVIGIEPDTVAQGVTVVCGSAVLFLLAGRMVGTKKETGGRND